MNFHDTRETRDPEARERELLARLPAQIAHARAAGPALRARRQIGRAPV